MKCSTKYVGLDVPQSTTLATVRQSSGKIIARSVPPTKEAALLEFFAGMRGAMHVAFEEGTQARREDERGGLRTLPHPRRLRHEPALMIRRSDSAAVHQGRRVRAAPWWLAALDAAGGAPGALNAVGSPRRGTFRRPTAAPSARSSHRLRLT
jgi:hypothetical protein